jgi:hypothetical protein
MYGSKSGQIITPMLVMLAILSSGCERTIEEEVVQPIEAIYGQKNVASLETALSNVRTVRSALMRYPATSSENLYPEDMKIIGYDSLRQVLTDENLPADMSELMWDPSYGISYLSDGYTFKFKVRALGGEKVITATPNGVKVEE